MISLKHKIRHFFPKHKIKIELKGITTLIGAGCMNFLIGAIFSLCTLAVYEISYIKGKGGSVSIEDLTFYYPIEIFFQCISSFISGLVYKKIGLHLTNLIGTIILSSGYYMMYISSSLTLDIISMILGGIGTGIIFYPSTTNAYEWFKDHNGIIVGIMETMISFGSFFFSYIGEKIINMDEIESNNIDNLYDFEISKQIKFYLLILIISLISTFILSFILMFEKKVRNYNILVLENRGSDLQNFGNVINKEKIDNKIDKKQESSEPSKNNTKKEDKLDIENNLNAESKKTKDNNLINSNQKEKKEKNINDKIEPYLKVDNLKEINNNNKIKEQYIKALLKISLKSNRLKLFCAIVILQAPVANMAFSLYREIGEYKKINTKYLQMIGSYYFIFECISSFIFGILCDYIKLKYLLYFINIVGTFVGYIYCLTFNNSLLYFLIQNFISFSYGGYYSIKDCYLMKVYGKDIYIELSSIVSMLVAFSINLWTPITFFILSKMEDKDKAYWILFFSFGSMNLIGLILNCYLKESPINLKERYKNENEVKI